jgi:hypothetical protein
MTPLLQKIPDNVDFASQISFAQALKLTRSSVAVRGLDRIYEASKSSEAFEADLDTITKSLDSLKVSIDTYSSAPLLQKIKGIFNGTCIKMWVLSCALSTVTKAVNREVWNLYSLDEIPQVSFVKSKFTPKTPGERIRDTKANAIARKYVVVNTVYQQFLNNNPDEAFRDQTANEVNEYFLGKLGTLFQGVDATIPRFFHATKDQYWTTIVKDQKLKEFNAPLGFGAYVSTGDESHTGYGPYTFGLTHNSVYRHPASYYQGGHNMWVRVEHEIELSPRTVSHFVANDKATCVAAGEKFYTTLGFCVPVISRAANDILINLFNQVITQRPLSKRWRRMSGHIFDTLPAAMTPYSLKVGYQYNKCF